MLISNVVRWQPLSPETSVACVHDCRPDGTFFRDRFPFSSTDTNRSGFFESVTDLFKDKEVKDAAVLTSVSAFHMHAYAHCGSCAHICSQDEPGDTVTVMLSVCIFCAASLHIVNEL